MDVRERCGAEASLERHRHEEQHAPHDAGLEDILNDDAHHEVIEQANVESIINAELADGQSIDLAIDGLILTHKNDDNAHHEVFESGDFTTAFALEDFNNLATLTREAYQTELIPQPHPWHLRALNATTGIKLKKQADTEYLSSQAYRQLGEAQQARYDELGLTGTGKKIYIKK